MIKSVYLSEQHEKFRQKVRDFAEKEIKPVARELDEKEEFSIELTRKMGQLGLFGITLPRKYSGHEMDTLSYIIAVEEIARIDSSQAATVAAHNSLGIYPIYRFGTEEQKNKFLPRLTTGEKLWAFGLTEKNAGSDARGTETRAEKKDDHWLINGEKQYITNSSVPICAGVTLQVITAEKDGVKELTTILVERDTPGYTSSKMDGKLMWRAADTGRLYFRDVKVPLSNLLGEMGHGPNYMFETLDGGRLSIAAMGLGLAQGAFEMALDYSKRRVQFGKVISKNQSIAFKISDMHMKIEHAREYLYKACWLKDQGLSYSNEAAMAKLYCSEVAREVADDSLQIHGGYGLFKNNDIERFYRDQRLLQIGEGTSEILRLVISRNLGL
ncbi:MAG: acyl-CoA dehydrogenase family protein [Bacteroidales bacterium]|nr:acyl-CoA dehydrogenase family protein [Bacteroidales bacterium]MCB8999084.1 acyl-CoA dehydrogenase family protein [Bacteroidales bacterium]